MSAYLTQGEYPAFGIPDNGNPDALVAQASALVDAVCKRPEGLTWGADFTGRPAYMVGLSAPFPLKLSSAIQPGLNVSAQVQGPTSMLQPGDVLVADRTTDNACEALVIQSVQGQTVVFRAALSAHAAGAILEPGLQIVEQRFMPANRPITMLANCPVAALISGSGRYGYGRRGGQATSNMDDFNLLAALSSFGGPPVWEVFDPATADIDPRTGQCWVPAGILLAYYTEVKLRYVAGFPATGVPDPIKRAVSILATALADAPQLGAVKSFKAGDTAITRFADTMVSGDVRDMLRPYTTRVMA